ncbi:MAG: Gfo/Idh/MocA family oxidoreductase [Candidatus Omnitrophica bacterium]|nr:Gfo/Idh/MocA family oxidoreductase [Candidatus Omnitrophota bacterium]
MITIGVIGCGHWGPNHIRIFNHLPSSSVKICADMSEDRLQAVALLYPQVQRTKHYQEILKDPEIDAVCISTPTDTHFQLTKEALEAGKHVLCEKPLALRPEECLQLQVLAEKKKKMLMVGHIFLFNLGIARLKEYIEAGQLGRIHYAHSSRTNLGPFRYDVNALWDLAPHDISIFNYLLGSAPLNVSARGVRCLGTSLEDLAFVSLEYPNQILVNLHVSWLDPKKNRQITIVGDQKMVTWDDLDNEGPIKLYDKHVEKGSRFYENYGEFQLLSREGSITIPHMAFHEPLKLQGQYFLECIFQNRHPEKCDAQKAYDVVRTLQAAQESMQKNGAPVEVKQR